MSHDRLGSVVQRLAIDSAECAARREFSVGEVNQRHAQYPAVTWRSTLNRCAQSGMVPFSLQLEDGSVLRLRIDAEQAQRLCSTLAEAHGLTVCGSQSANSSGSPSVDGSVAPGQSQWPPTRSSSAAQGS